MHYNKLIGYLEEDVASIRFSFHGEVMEEYRAIVQREIIMINKNIDLLKRTSIT